MSLNDFGLLTFVTISIALLLVFWAFNRWWRERAYHLEGKTVLITGGSRGVGLALARQLVEADACVAICARDEAELQRARNQLEQQRDGNVFAITCDVTDQAQVKQMIQQVKEHFGAIDILINNAGTDIISSIEDLTMQDYDDMMKLHFWAPIYTTYAVFPEMQQRQMGRIVNIASVGGKTAAPHMVAYCASKFALVGLSEGLRAELAKDGIVVTTVCPGLIHSGVIDHAIVKGQNRKEFTWFGIGDSLPLFSASADKVASVTIAGFRRGASEIVVPLSTWFSIKFYGLFPGLNTDLLAIFNQFLPKPGGIGKERTFGRDSHSTWAPSWMTYLSDRAAEKNNELPVVEPKDPTKVKQVEGDQDRSTQPIAVEDETSRMSN